MRRQCEDLHRLGHAAAADLAAGEIARGGADLVDAAGSKRRDIRLRCRVLPHHGVHGWGDQHGLVGGEQRGGSKIVGDAMGQLGDQIGARRRDDHEIGLPRQADMAHLAFIGEREEFLIDPVLAEGRNRQRRDELGPAFGQDRAHANATLAQAPD